MATTIGDTTAARVRAGVAGTLPGLDLITGGDAGAITVLFALLRLGPLSSGGRCGRTVAIPTTRSRFGERCTVSASLGAHSGLGAITDPVAGSVASSRYGILDASPVLNSVTGARSRRRQSEPGREGHNEHGAYCYRGNSLTLFHVPPPGVLEGAYPVCPSQATRRR
ncbi:MAG: hypothetical protein GXX83_09725 [Gaiellales bacterium]|nr:hypothetical protein [Gaiellales bacterium]